MVMPLGDFGLYGILMNVYVIITVIIILLLRYFGHYGIIFVTLCVCCYKLSRHS
jgi:hypothetical protein